MSIDSLRVGPKAIATLHHFESCSLKAYRDAVGVPTIGWGNTYYLDGSCVQMGDRITQAEADELFAAVVERDFAAPIRKALGNSKTTPAQFGAMVCLAYNIGFTRFSRSTVFREHLAGNHNRAMAAFAMWNKAGGRVLPGLTRRRSAEAALYRSDFAALERYTNGEVRA
jgi:lysozyme